MAALAGRPVWPAAEAPLTAAASLDLGSAQASMCGTPIPLADAPAEPPASLRCVQDAQGIAQLELDIAAGAPVILTDVAGQSLLSGQVALEPWTLSLRRLPGPPPLYWLRYWYRDEGEGGAGGAGHWRDLVWRADTAAPALVAEWSLASDRFSRVELHEDQAESLTLDYRPPTLWVTRRRAERTDWDAPGLAPYECAQDCATGADPEGRESGASACRRDCERERLLTVNRVTTLQSEVRRIEVPTGAESPVSTAWATTYEPLPRPGNARPGGRLLLILDDGAAAWLLVPMQGPDLSPAGGLDPAAPGPIPALASCRLYNHDRPAAGAAGHPYPPAPPAQVRSDDAPPAACCTIESSPDGRRVLVFGTPPAATPQDGSAAPPAPRRLLALYDVAAGQCWSANLAVDGSLGRAPYDRLGDPVFSPDGRHLGFRAQRGDSRFVVVDDREGPVFHRVGAPVFSADGRHTAYWARDRGREFIVLDGTAGPGWVGAGSPVFSPAGGPPAYRVREAKGWRALVGGTPGPLFDDIGWFKADPTGRGTATADLVFSAKGELAYAARAGSDWFMVRDHRRGPAYEQVGLPVFSPDGTRLAFRAGRNERDFIVLDGQPGPQYSLVGTPVFSADGRQLAYWAADAWTEFVVWGSSHGPRVSAIVQPLPPLTNDSAATKDTTAPVQDPAPGEPRAAPGRVWAPVFARTANEPVYAVGLKPGPSDEGSTLTVKLWSGDQPRPDGEVGAGAVLNRITGEAAWWDTRGDSAQVVFQGRHLSGDSAGDAPHHALVFSPDGRVLAYATNRDGRARMRIGETDDGPFDEVGDPVFSPAGDRLAYRARLGTVWFPIVAPLAGTAAPAVRPSATAPLDTAPLDDVAARLLPRPVAVGGIIVGGSAHGRWFGPQAVMDGDGAPASGGDCVPIGPDRVEPTLRWRVYGPDRLLGEYTGGQVADCPQEDTGTRQLRLALPDRDLQESSVAVAGGWNALPRRARSVTDTDRFATLVAQLRERLGRKALPLRDLRVQAIDLDGDGRGEYLVRAAGGSVPGSAAIDEPLYVLLLLARSDQDPQPRVLCDWSGVSDNIGDCEVSHLLDLNGDGTLEIIIRYSAYEEWGVQVFTLEGARPVKTPLGWWDGV